MSTDDRFRWEVQWHPASATRVRHLILTPSGVLRMIMVLGVTGLIAIAGAMLPGIERSPTGLELDAARRESSALMAQQETLRRQASDLVERLSEDLDRGNWMARLAAMPSRAWGGESQRPPISAPPIDATIAWLSEESARLEALGAELATVRPATVGNQALAQGPTREAGGGAHNGGGLQVADTGSTRPLEATPARLRRR